MINLSIMVALRTGLSRGDPLIEDIKHQYYSGKPVSNRGLSGYDGGRDGFFSPVEVETYW